MNIKLLVVLYIFVIVGSSTYYSGNITVEGDGQISARTNIDFAKDFVQGSGVQTYERGFTLGKDESTFISDYSLSSSDHADDLQNYTKKNPFNITVYSPEAYSKSSNNNRYSIAMNIRSDGLNHRVSVDGALPDTIIESHGEIKFTHDAYSKGEVITNFSVVGENSTLSESITEDLGGRPYYLVETWVKGNFRLISNFSDDVIGYQPPLNMSARFDGIPDIIPSVGR